MSIREQEARTTCRFCGSVLSGNELVVWDSADGDRQVNASLDDLLHLNRGQHVAAVAHGVCFINQHGAAEFVHLAQREISEALGSLNEAVVRLSKYESK